MAVALAVALGAACRDPRAGPGRLSGPGHLPVARVLLAREPIAVDGSLDEPAWRTAFEVPLVDSMTGAPPVHPTTARLLWDERHLYVAFEVADDDVVVRPGRADDDAIWEDEVVEVFVDPAGTGRGYAEVDLSPANVRFDARFASWRSDLAAARTWSSGATTATRIRRGGDGAPGWTAEMALPLEALRGAAPPPRPGSRWRANLYRLEIRNRAGVREGQAFSPPLRPDFHALERFGWIVFDGGP